MSQHFMEFVVKFGSSFSVSVCCKWCEIREAAEGIWQECHLLGDVLLRISQDYRHGVLPKFAESHTDGPADYGVGESGMFNKPDRVMCVRKQTVCK